MIRTFLRTIVLALFCSLSESKERDFTKDKVVKALCWETYVWEKVLHVMVFFYWQAFWPETLVMQNIGSNFPGERFCSWRMLGNFLRFCYRIWCHIRRT